MIRLEDADFEEFFFSEFPDIAIPIEIRVDRNGACVITTYRRTETIARELEARFSSDPFSEEALRYLDTALRPIVSAWGYRPDKRCESYILNYEAASASQIDRSVILPESRILFALPEGVGNRTTYDFEEENEDPKSVTVKDGKVVSLACVNPYDAEEDERELNTETAPQYRGRGYSASNTARLALELLKRGNRVTYNCNVKNIASRRVAEKCGFTYVGRSYYYVCYREE
ncbi:MAG: GNAT family N-acetyltransferase [Clostridia bacterium]|nr:GNAT family N-acetyltransferase [Clostridia bacterium]